MDKLKSIRNPFLIYAPFIFFYITYILLFNTKGNWTDEQRYMFFANNLIHGYYSPPAPDFNLWNGPGYPILIMPFVALGLPALSIALMNAFFHYLSAVFIFKSLERTTSFKIALIAGLFWACYFNSFQPMPVVYTEPFSMFLISLLIYLFLKAFNSDRIINSKKYIILSGLVFGFLVLTKIVFGYILVLLLFLFFIFSFIKHQTANYRIGRNILIIAMLINVPYLIYTFQLTGKVFYWGNSGGASLYWMSTPYDDEYGDWVGKSLKTYSGENFNIQGSGDSLVARHGKDYEKIYALPLILQDGMYTKLAIQNIKSKPLKFAKNIFYNLGRMFFHYPFSYSVQKPKTLLVLPLNAILFTFFILSIIPTILNWNRINFAIRFMIVLLILYLGVSSLVSAYLRMFIIMVPIFLVWFGYIIHNVIRINIKFPVEQK